MESPYFPIPLRKMPGSIVIEELDVPEFSCGAFSIRAARMNHPGMTMGYRLATGDGTMVYIPDNEIARSAEGVHHPGLSIPGRTPGEIRKNLAGFIHGADVLIMDAQYEREEYAAHAGWGHGCVEDVVEIAVKSGVQRLFLFHHDPSRDDACVGRMVEQARDQAASLGSGLVINAAREGLEIVLQK